MNTVKMYRTYRKDEKGAFVEDEWRFSYDQHAPARTEAGEVKFALPKGVHMKEFDGDDGEDICQFFYGKGHVAFCLWGEYEYPVVYSPEDDEYVELEPWIDPRIHQQTPVP